MSISDHGSVGRVGLGTAPSVQPERKADALTTFVSPSTGEKHSITSVSQKLTTDEVSHLREALQKEFGASVAGTALREIESTLAQGNKVTGGQVMTAMHVAVEHFAPGAQLARAELKAKTELVDSRANLQQATERLADARTELESANRAYDNRDTQFGDALNKGVYDDKKKAEKKLTDATANLGAANKRLASAEKGLTSATQDLKLYRDAIGNSIGRGEDRLALQKDVESCAVHQMDCFAAVTTAKAALKEAQGELEVRNDNDRTWGEGVPSAFKPGLVKETADAAKLVQQRTVELDKANEHLALAQKAFTEANQKLVALETGPVFRKAQALLDHLPEDKRFTDALKSLDQSKLGWVGGKALSIALPPVHVGKLFYSSIKAEDAERSLRNASSLMSGQPLAQAMCRSLEHHHETEKFRLGIEGTLGFVGMAVTLKGASAVGAMASGATSLVGQAVQQGTQTLGLAGLALTEGSKIAVTAGPKAVVDKALEVGTKEVAARHDATLQGEAALAKMEQAHKALGAALPVIPVGTTEGGKEKVLPLSDPKAAMALLHYLGPKEDPTLKGTPAEDRRMQLRDEFFGAKPNEDLGPTKGDPGVEARVHEELDRGMLEKTFTNARGQSALHLMYSALGWTKTS